MGQPPDFEAYAAVRRVHLRRIAYLLCGDWDRAEDLVQDALARLFVHWRRASRADNVDAYVRRTHVNAYLADQRRLWRRDLVTATVPDTAVAGPTLGRRDELERPCASSARRSGRWWCCGTGTTCPSSRPPPP